jgi:TPR repeat protein
MDPYKILGALPAKVRGWCFARPRAQLDLPSEESEALEEKKLQGRPAWGLYVGTVGARLQSALRYIWDRFTLANVATLIGLLIAGLLTYEAVSDHSVVIRPTLVPKSLDEKGYHSDAVARLILDNIRTFRIQTSVNFQSRAPLSLKTERRAIEFKVPTTEFTVADIADMIRKLLRINLVEYTSELYQTVDGYKFTFRSSDVTHQPRVLTGSDLDALLHSAAIEVMRDGDPLTMAVYYISMGDSAAPDAIEALLLSEEPLNVAYGYVALGYVQEQQGQFDQALALYHLALRVAGDDFGIALNNMSSVYFKRGDCKTGLEFVHRAADLGTTLAEDAMGGSFQGTPCPDSPHLSPSDALRQQIYWFGRAARKGLPQSEASLGLALFQQSETSSGSERDRLLDEGFRWLREGARRGYGAARLALANELWRGAHLPKDCYEAEFWLKQATKPSPARLELPPGLAALQLGKFYDIDACGMPMPSKAKEWYDVAARAGQDEAKHLLSKLAGPEQILPNVIGSP